MIEIDKSELKWIEIGWNWKELESFVNTDWNWLNWIKMDYSKLKLIKVNLSMKRILIIITRAG